MKKNSSIKWKRGLIGIQIKNNASKKTNLLYSWLKKEIKTIKEKRFERFNIFIALLISIYGVIFNIMPETIFGSYNFSLFIALIFPFIVSSLIFWILWQFFMR